MNRGRIGFAALMVALAIGCESRPAERGVRPAGPAPGAARRCGLAPATLAILGRLEAPVAVLVRSSDRAWLQRSPKVAPDFVAHRDTGFPPPPARTARAEFPLAVAVGRIAVVGSSSFASDELLELSRQAGGDLENLVLAGNLVALARGDTELLALHACRGASAPAPPD